MPQLDWGMNVIEFLAKFMWFMLIYLLSLPKSNHLQANGKTILFKDREINIFSQFFLFFMQQDSNHCPWMSFSSPTLGSGMPWLMQSTNYYFAQKARVSDQNHASCLFWSALLFPKVKGKKQKDTIFSLGNL